MRRSRDSRDRRRGNSEDERNERRGVGYDDDDPRDRHRDERMRGWSASPRRSRSPPRNLSEDEGSPYNRRRRRRMDGGGRRRGGIKLRARRGDSRGIRSATPPNSMDRGRSMSGRRGRERFPLSGVNNLPVGDRRPIRDDGPEETVRFWVNHNDCAKVIGRRGQTMRHMESKTGCKMKVQREDEMDPKKKERYVEIVGTQSQNQACLEILLQLTNYCRDVNHTVLKDERQVADTDEVLVVEVLAEEVGRVLGRKGDHIKKIEIESHTKLEVDKITGRCEIYGKEENQKRALELVLLEVSWCKDEKGEMLKNEPRHDHKNSGEERGPPLRLWVHDRECGKVIGRGGETVREIMSKTSTDIKVRKNDDADPGSERLIEIWGPPENQQEAVDAVLSEVTYCRGEQGVIKKPTKRESPARRRSPKRRRGEERRDDEEDASGDEARGDSAKGDGKGTEGGKDKKKSAGVWICSHCGGDHRSKECPHSNGLWGAGLQIGMQMGMQMGLGIPPMGPGLPGPMVPGMPSMGMMPLMPGMPPGMGPMGMKGMGGMKGGMPPMPPPPPMPPSFPPLEQQRGAKRERDKSSSSDSGSSGAPPRAQAEQAASAGEDRRGRHAERSNVKHEMLSPEPQRSKRHIDNMDL